MVLLIMPQANFTDQWLKSVKLSPNGQVEYYDQKLTGLALRISPGGTKAWLAWYRHGGRLRKTTLGRYPAMALAKARREAIKVQNEDIDPAALKKQERLAKTFAELAAEYMERHAKRMKKSWKEDHR